MPEDEQRQWRYELDEVGPDADSDSDGRAIEPGSPNAENVAFFVLGVATMVGVVGLLLFT